MGTVEGLHIFDTGQLWRIRIERVSKFLYSRDRNLNGIRLWFVRCIRCHYCLWVNDVCVKDARFLKEWDGSQRNVRKGEANPIWPSECCMTKRTFFPNPAFVTYRVFDSLAMLVFDIPALNWLQCAQWTTASRVSPSWSHFHWALSSCDHFRVLSDEGELFCRVPHVTKMPGVHLYNYRSWRLRLLVHIQTWCNLAEVTIYYYIYFSCQV